MSDIKFGTDGWRAIIGAEFTTANVARVSEAVASWLHANENRAPVVIGHDCRFGGRMFAETVAMVLASRKIRVILSDRMVSTPIISLATKELSASLGIIITASHNPPSYNGFKLKASFGGPMPPSQVAEIERLIPAVPSPDFALQSWEKLNATGLITEKDIESLYLSRVRENFDLDLIASRSVEFAYDAMYGAGQGVMKKLLPGIRFLHAEMNPGFGNTPPEPIHRNLGEFSNLIIGAKGSIKCGLATDGDADRLGIYNSRGEFIDSHHIILLLIKYLAEEKKLGGKVVNAFSVSPRVATMCSKLGLPYQVVKIGFKYVSEIMVADDVLLGGEESGGIAIKTHIPERDGVWIGLTIWEYMARTGKSIEALIEEVYSMVGRFSFERIDLHLTEEQKSKIMDRCRKGLYNSFGKYKVERSEDTDGYKYYFGGGRWVMIRPSGTEPVLRTYAEGDTYAEAIDILGETHRSLSSS